MSYQKLQWVVQKNLTQAASYQAIYLACQDIGIDFFGFILKPFAAEAPEYPKEKQPIFYGSTSLMNQVHPNPGLFFHPTHFSMENYLQHYADKMLNHGASLTNFAQLIKEDYPADKLLFIRPDADSKSFSGTVMSFSEIRSWVQKLGVENSAQSVTTRTPIIVGEAFHIKEEWRLWIVNKKVVAASQYAFEHQLVKKEGCPKEVIDFAEQVCLSYVPEAIFVMDICRCGEDYYIVECGCMNSAGFYAADIGAIVTAVSDFIANASS